MGVAYIDEVEVYAQNDDDLGVVILLCKDFGTVIE